MIIIKASWFEIIIVAVIVNILAQVVPPVSYYFSIVVNFIVFTTFLYGVISDKFKGKSN